MAKGTIKARRAEFKNAIIRAGIEYGANFYALPMEHVYKLAELAKAFKYRTDGNRGSLARAFYYSALLAD